MTDRLLTAKELARVLNVEPGYVYEHADELGALRLGNGPRARLRFDLDEVERRLRPGSCFTVRESEEAETPANRRVRSRRTRSGTGTDVVLLPIRGRPQPAARREEAS